MAASWSTCTNNLGKNAPDQLYELTVNWTVRWWKLKVGLSPGADPEYRPHSSVTPKAGCRGNIPRDRVRTISLYPKCDDIDETSDSGSSRRKACSRSKVPQVGQLCPLPKGSFRTDAFSSEHPPFRKRRGKGTKSWNGQDDSLALGDYRLAVGHPIPFPSFPELEASKHPTPKALTPELHVSKELPALSGIIDLLDSLAVFVSQSACFRITHWMHARLASRCTHVAPVGAVSRKSSSLGTLAVLHTSYYSKTISPFCPNMHFIRRPQDIPSLLTSSILFTSPVTLRRYSSSIPSPSAQLLTAITSSNLCLLRNPVPRIRVAGRAGINLPHRQGLGSASNPTPAKLQTPTAQSHPLTPEIRYRTARRQPACPACRVSRFPPPCLRQSTVPLPTRYPSPPVPDQHTTHSHCLYVSLPSLPIRSSNISLSLSLDRTAKPIPRHSFLTSNSPLLGFPSPVSAVPVPFGTSDIFPVLPQQKHFPPVTMQPKAAMPVPQIRPAMYVFSPFLAHTLPPSLLPKSRRHFPPTSSRHRGLIVVTAAVTAVAVSFRYTALSRRTNDQNQCSSNPYYVSVDRSGGGI
ncbi:uncharacterized protein CLUP02_17468 [Colletotrichum lupini]|uniref:Uncharacterized protein n=1 Tax=Colletotrichum lupini TaxID=145971 RepID=A0A9Q8SET7_9PEZI|nr:uncharacterized protein CLUP02_17468 [Colletotrichum lupini]UQC75959.1 hypothetical protein CLUP02_17468 [Colletotrichum lupini]